MASTTPQSPSELMVRPEQARPVSAGNVVGGFATTTLLHAFIILAVVVGTITGSKAVEEHIEEKIAPFTPVELVRLGEPRKPNALPRIANPEKRVVEEDVVNLAQPDPDKVVLEKKPEDKPKDVERVEKKKSTRDLLNAFNNPSRPTNDDVPEGQADGVPEGTLSDAALSHLMNTYQAKVMRDILRQWKVPSTITPDSARDLAGKVAVAIRLSADGDIVSYRMVKTSGDSQFDLSVERAIKSFMVRFGGQKLSMPEDPSLKQAVINKGLFLRRWEYTGR